LRKEVLHTTLSQFNLLFTSHLAEPGINLSRRLLLKSG